MKEALDGKKRHLDTFILLLCELGFYPYILSHCQHCSSLVSRSQTPPLFDIWTAGRESGALALKLSFRELPEVGSGY